MAKIKKHNRRRRNSLGQGITEYGAIIAFVALLVALVFSITSGTLRGAISAAFSSVTSQLNNLSDTSSNSS
jgi:Flp pilus assembly pilin Flp